MKYLIYGDDLKQASEVLREILERIKQEKGADLVHFNPESDDYHNWLEAVNPSLYNQPKIIKVNRLFTGRKSKLKERLKKELKTLQRTDLDIIVFESKLLKNPPRFFDKVLKFKQKVYLFEILDKFGLKQFHQLPSLIYNDKTAYELLLFMLVKRLQEIMIWKSSKMIPKGFYQQKLKRQAGLWRVAEIIDWQASLLNFDLEHKTGRIKHKDIKLALSLYLFSQSG